METNNKKQKIKHKFIAFFDGWEPNDTNDERPSTWEMGICSLDFHEMTNKLVVSLRRPGLLIGRQGRQLDELLEYLDCDIDIEEVNLLDDQTNNKTYLVTWQLRSNSQSSEITPVTISFPSSTSAWNKYNKIIDQLHLQLADEHDITIINVTNISEI